MRFFDAVWFCRSASRAASACTNGFPRPRVRPGVATFTPADIGTTVESAAGDTLGSVVEVDDETAYVAPDREVTHSIKAALE